MTARSAGVLLFRRAAVGPEFLLVHPGGPFWAGRDDAAWSIPKGLVDDGEDPRAAAFRELAEETGLVLAPTGEPLSPCRASGKTIVAWLVEGDFDPARLVSNTFVLEWPPRSGRRVDFPEVDRAAWFDPATALVRIHRGQQPIVREALVRLSSPS